MRLGILKRIVFVLLMMELLALPAMVVAVSPLESVCPVDWRGVSLQEALGELAAKMAVPYILDQSTGSEILDSNIRMLASHLTGEQVFRWLARSAGLEAVLIDGTFLLAPADQLPSAWLAAGRGGSSSRMVSVGPARPDMRSRRGIIDWVDTPLSRVARDVSRSFNIDVIYHPDILGDQPLVTLQKAEVDLDIVCRTLQDQLGAVVDIEDGAVWVHPGGGVPGPVPGFGASAAQEVPETGPGVDRLLRVPMVIDRIATWLELADRLGRTVGAVCRIEVPPGSVNPDIEAKGSVVDILEAARMLGYLKWYFEPAETGEGEMILRLQICGPD